jgi:ABC-type multidrug transport system ATPase subunit
MLSVDDLSVTFGDTQTTALRSVNLSLAGGKTVLVGANGSGKTTLIRAILGLTPITSGHIRVFGREVRTLRGDPRVATNLAEVYRLVSLPVRDVVAIFARLKGGDGREPLRWLQEFELGGVLDRRSYQLSTGQQKMVSNLLAVSFHPELVLLDEPFDNVDFGRRRRLVRILQGLPAAVLLNTHELELLRYFSGWALGLMFEGQVLGPFQVADLDRLFLSRGRATGALAVLDSNLGTFSVTLDRGDVPVKSATSLTALVETVL